MSTSVHAATDPTLPAAGAFAPARARALGHVAPAPVVGVIVAAWALTAAGEVLGASPHFAHDAVIEAALPPGVGLGLFLVGWLVMVSAMMLPASLPALKQLPGGSAGPAPVGRFLGGFGLLWAAAGVAVLSMDTAVHRVVAGVPALTSRPSLVLATTLAVAGALQLAPATRRRLAAVSMPSQGTTAVGWTAGWAHAARCVRADGPLMLVMFAAGTSLATMVLLTAIMAGERSARFGRALALSTGVALLAGAGLVALGFPLLPSEFGDR